MDVPHAAIVLLSVLTTAGDVIEWLVELPLAVYQAYSSLLRWAADSVHSLFESYGYWVVFLGTLFENTLLLGLIVPGVLVVLLAGINSHDGAMSPGPAVALGIVGTVCGDTISYFLGHFVWRRLGHWRSLRELEEKVRQPLQRRGAHFVLIYHFFGYTRLLGPAAAGFLKMPYPLWAAADYAGACLWVGVYFGIGYGLGALGIRLESTDRYFRFVEWGLLIVVLVVGYQVYRFGQRRWREHEAEEETAVTSAE